jgi:stage V sporulation protein SpoVS
MPLEGLSSEGSAAPFTRAVRAAGTGLVLLVAAVLSYATYIGQMPAAAAVPPLAAIGAGKLGLLSGQQLDRSGRPPAGTEAIARDAAAAWPLAYEPLYAAALARSFAAEGAADSQVTAMLRESIRRNPRAREARLLLMRQAVGSGDIGEAIRQLAVLRRLGSEAAGQLLIGLAQAISTERQVDEAAATLRNHPELYNTFVLSFTRAGKPPQLALRLASQLPPSALSDSDVVRAAVDAMVNAQAFDQAKAIWSRYNRQSGDALVHSPTFADARSTPPFNWELAGGQVGAAEQIAGGGLTLSYYGRSPGPLARQVLVLPPGTYRAELEYQHDRGTPGAIALTVRCATPGQVMIASTPLAAAKPGRQKLQLPFTVASSCPGQLLSLEGLTHVERRGQDATAWRLNVLPAGRP